MKKRVLSLVIVCLLCVGLSVTAQAEEKGPFTFDGGMTTDADFSELPQMWVGDLLQIDTYNYDYDILEGAENIEADFTVEENQYQQYYKGSIKFIKAGNTEIKVTRKGGTGEAKLYNFTIVPAETPYIEYLIPKQIKIGTIVDNLYVYHNCLFNKDNTEYYPSNQTKDDWTSLFLMATGWVAEDTTFPSTRTAEGVGWLSGCAAKPGTFHVASKTSEREGDPYIVTIEEPIINTNLPQKVQVGKELQMTTSLDNTDLVNRKIVDIKWSYPEQRFPLGYQPKVEIISGAELVERGTGDYSHILNSSEKIKFIGEGVVTFKVTYEMLPINDENAPVMIEDEAIYNPEKTFTVEVTSEGQGSGMVTDQTDGKITADTGGLDWESICENNNVDLSTSNVEVTLTQEKAAQEDSAKLEQRAGKDGSTIKAVYEILMTLYADGNKVADLTEGFGTLKLDLQVGKDYSGKKAVVYQLHNGKDVIVHDGLTVNAEGAVTITADKLSTFAVAIADGNSVQKPSSGTANNTTQQTANSGSVQTGDHTNITLWVTLCIASFLTIAFLVRKRVFRNIR